MLGHLAQGRRLQDLRQEQEAQAALQGIQAKLAELKVGPLGGGSAVSHLNSGTRCSLGEAGRS